MTKHTAATASIPAGMAPAHPHHLGGKPVSVGLSGNGVAVTGSAAATVGGGAGTRATTSSGTLRNLKQILGRLGM